MKGDRFISVCLLISLVFLLFGIFDRDRKPAAGTFSVDSGTEEEITDELVIALFIEDITNEITDFYSAYYSGEITVYNYEVIIVGIVKEELGFISVRFGVTPQIGAHNPLGHLSMIFDAKWQNFCVRKNTYANVGISTRFLTDKPAVMISLP